MQDTQQKPLTRKILKEVLCQRLVDFGSDEATSLDGSSERVEAAAVSKVSQVAEKRQC